MIYQPQQRQFAAPASLVFGAEVAAVTLTGWLASAGGGGAGKCPTGNNTAPMRDGGRNVRGRE